MGAVDKTVVAAEVIVQSNVDVYFLHTDTPETKVAIIISTQYYISRSEWQNIVSTVVYSKKRLNYKLQTSSKSYCFPPLLVKGSRDPSMRREGLLTVLVA